MLYEIFVRKIFVLKNFCRVDVLQKYFNTKILQQKLGRMYWESNCHGKVRNCIRGYHVYKKSTGGDGWRGVGVRKRAQNSSDRYAVAVKNEGLS